MKENTHLFLACESNLIAVSLHGLILLDTNSLRQDNSFDFTIVEVVLFLD